jgi:hypothetical protein
VATLALAGAVPANAQKSRASSNPASPPVVIKDPLPAAAALIDRGRYTEAALILDAIDELPPQDRAKFDASSLAWAITRPRSSISTLF